MSPVTLARKLGTTTHISPLLMKAQRLGLPTGEHREALAVARGVRYYGGGSLPEAPAISRAQLSDEELAMALLSIAAPYSPQSLRVGAAMSSGQLIDARRLAWLARLERSEELRPRGLYITHLFQSNQVFLRDDWLEHLVPISRPPLRYLRLSRPGTLDLILTKMMRGDDAQDMEDVAFLIRHGAVTRAQLEETMRRARLSDIPELHDAFAKAKPLVLALAMT